MHDHDLGTTVAWGFLASSVLSGQTGRPPLGLVRIHQRDTYVRTSSHNNDANLGPAHRRQTDQEDEEKTVDYCSLDCHVAFFLF